MINANWIKSGETAPAPIFEKSFNTIGGIKKATLKITARGCYEAFLNGERLFDDYLAPGWTVYEKRIQFKEIDLTDKIKEDNTLLVQLTSGWYYGRIAGFEANQWLTVNPVIYDREAGIISELLIEYENGKTERISTDESWSVFEGAIRSSDIYDGIVYDATAERVELGKAVFCSNNDKSVLIPETGVKTKEQERILPVKIIKTPKGETVIDFGQNFTGVPEICLTAKRGDRVRLSFGEILGPDGNFYNGNYRTAKCRYDYTCRDGEQIWHPTTTFYGFRYLRIDEFPFEPSLNNFEGIVLHSDMKKTGEITSSSALLNRLVSNIFWGQKCNYLDIPTDCPQRDERYGWTGDAQVFVRAASYNYDVNDFFKKWLVDVKLEQHENGDVSPVVPAAHTGDTGAAWGDVITVAPWQMYLSYADKDILEEMFPAMKKWVDFITNDTKDEFMWTGHWQYGDWVELNAPWGESKGLTREEIVSAAYYAYSALIVAKAGRLLGEDVSFYEELYKNIVKKYKETYRDEFFTQTEHVLTLYFGLTDNPEKVAASLVNKIKEDGGKLQTGFVGTPYLLHALSQNGYSEEAYKLLLREEYPSWLYSVTKGATTMWEHWDGIMPDGRIWPDVMNSYNHYAYGAVADWLYSVAAGINPIEEAPGFEKIYIKPHPTDMLEFFGAKIETRHGTVSSRWWHEGDELRYEIITPVSATVVIGEKEYTLQKGTYRF